MNIGFIGFGEAAYNIALGLGGEGVTGLIAFDAMADHEVFGKLVHSRATEAKAELLPAAKDVVKRADLIFAAVPSTHTMEVCETILPELNAQKLYVDVSASTPEIKKQIWGLVEKTGVLFADAAMLGSLPNDKHRVPMMASGNGAKKYKEAADTLNMRVTYVNEEAGAASAIKLVRSIYMKGLEALMVETMQAADAYDVSEVVINSLSTSLDKFRFVEHLNRLVTGAAIHCVRRGHELEGSMEMQKDAGLSSSMAQGARDKHTEMEKFKFAERFVDRKPEGWQEIIAIMRNER
ncbi:MAG: DUF1932 domain-containing protein [Stomatobaculum sp.]